MTNQKPEKDFEELLHTWKTERDFRRLIERLL
jgi:hypothetical protein